MDIVGIRQKDLPPVTVVSDSDTIGLDGPAGTREILYTDFKAGLAEAFAGAPETFNPATSTLGGLVKVNANDAPGVTPTVYKKSEIDTFLPRINVASYPGADPTGATSSQAAVDAAYAALSATNGGELFFGPGKWKFNLVVTKPNVTISGVSHMMDVGGSATLTSHFIPANTVNPVIQVGNDTSFAKGFLMRECTLDGRAGGDYGIYFAGGSMHATLRNVAISLFKTCIRVKGGAVDSASLVFLERVDFQPSNVTGARGILVEQVANYPTSWTTAIYLAFCHGQGVVNGYCVEIDSCDLSATNSYFDTFDNHGFKVSKTQAQLPHLAFTNVSIDSGLSTNVAIESYNNSRLFVDVLSGTYAINGKWKMLDGTLLTPPQGSLKQNTLALYLNCLGTVNIVNFGEADFDGTNYTAHQIFANSGNLNFNTIGSVRVNPNTGIVQVGNANPTPDGNTYLRFNDAVSAKVTEIHSLGGFLDLRAINGSAVRFQNTAGSNWGQINAVDGAWFLFGAGQTANTGLYLDSNRQLKSSTVTVTAPGTTGAQTINKNMGRVNFAAGAQTLVVTNSLVTTSTIISALIKSDDTTAKSLIVSAQSAGSFTLKLNAAATAETAVDFAIFNGA